MLRFLWSWTSGEAVTPPAAPAASVGGGSAPKKTRRRHYVIGDRHVIVDDRTDIEWVVAALAAQDEVVPTPPAKKVKAKPAKPVERAEPEEEIDASVLLPVPRPVQVNWAALQVLLDQSRRLRQMEVADVILHLQRRWQDEDEAEVEMLLLA